MFSKSSKIAAKKPTQIHSVQFFGEKSANENNEKAIDPESDTSGPSTQIKETTPQSSETVHRAYEVCVFQSNWLSKFPQITYEN